MDELESNSLTDRRPEQARRLTSAREEAAGTREGALDELFPLVYAELRAIAANRMASERPDHTLQPTALVNEAYVRMLGGISGVQWQSRSHFFNAAAEAMRRILIDHARGRKRLRL